LVKQGAGRTGCGGCAKRGAARGVSAVGRARGCGHRQCLGPTVDDLSQEIAARAAGVELVLNEDWLQRMEDFFRRRNRVKSSNNKKQAMPPTTAEILDNPIGTACGFALDIGKARFYFTPGVPRELRRMLEEQIIPRLLARGGAPTAIYLKRFHTYGLGESHVDQLLSGVEELVPDGSVKLGFRMRVEEVMSLEEYDRRASTDWPHRIPNAASADLSERLGDCIYDFSGVTPVQRPGVHGPGKRRHRSQRKECPCIARFLLFRQLRYPSP
jgi:nicotinamide-nucleotide amidase